MPDGARVESPPKAAAVKGNPRYCLAYAKLPAAESI